MSITHRIKKMKKLEGLVKLEQATELQTLTVMVIGLGIVMEIDIAETLGINYIPKEIH